MEFHIRKQKANQNSKNRLISDIKKKTKQQEPQKFT